jgi:DNA polymerase-3 subunit beta
MEIKAKRGDLLATLYWTQSIVERRNTMPILANVMIEAQKSGIRITATDLEVGVRGSVEGEILKEGTVTVSAKKLYEIVREVPIDQVQLKRLDNDWVRFAVVSRCSRSSVWTLKSFPSFLNSIARFIDNSGVTVREMIERTIFSVSTDETRYSLNGVYIEQSEGTNVRMVATDGHR